MTKGSSNDPKNFVRDVNTVGHWGNGDYQVIVRELNDIGYLTYLIRQSHDKNE
jgi:predicted transport protein